MGRMATYSGKIVKWHEAINSDVLLACTDSLHSLDDPAPLSPNERGEYDVAIPGTSKVV